MPYLFYICNIWIDYITLVTYKCLSGVVCFMNKSAQKLLLASVVSVALLGIIIHAGPVGASPDKNGDNDAHGNGDIYTHSDKTSTITVSGSAVTTLDRNLLNINLGVSTIQDTATEALSENSIQLRNVIDAIKSAGISEDDISTAQFNLRPEYSDMYDYTQPRELIGYRVTNVISIHTDQLDKAADILDGAVSAGANVVERVWFSVSPEIESEARDNLISIAVDNAKHKAMLALESLDYRIVGVESMTLHDAGFATVTNEASFRLAADFASSPPILAGEEQLSVSVTITFYIE